MLARSIIAFHTGLFAVPRGLILGGDPSVSLGTSLGLGAFQMVMLPVLCFAIEVEDGWVLVDAGLVAPGRLARFEPAWAYSRRLEAIGIGRDRVRAAIVTHLDYDHTGGLRHLAPVTVYMSAAEWRRGVAPPLADTITRRLVPADYLGLQRVREVALPAAPREPWIDGIFEVPEARGAAAMVSLPGHTAGHAGVLVRLREGRRVLLCGDACYCAEQLTAGARPGLLARAVAHDRARAERTIAAIRRWRAADPELRVVASHDPSTGSLCVAGPARIA
jgi:glyoxylase-like metal-dependent hydrolase (beta-lactamase superfamily II)